MPVSAKPNVSRFIINYFHTYNPLGSHLKSTEEVQRFKEKCQAHNDFVVTERCAMAERQQLGVNYPDSYVHVSIDGSAGQH